MNDAKKTAEWVKTGIIIILTASALFLVWQSRMFNDLLRAVPIFNRVTEFVAGMPEPAVAVEAARPLVIVITDEDGNRYGVRYDTARRNTVYNATSGVLGEALGSKSMPVEIAEEQWRYALMGAGVYFEYILPVYLSVLNAWLGARMPDFGSDVLLRRIFVAFGEDTNRLYFEDYGTGRFFGADTVSPGGRAHELIYNPNGAMFAFETGVAGAVAVPYLVILPEPAEGHPVVRTLGQVSQEERLQTVLAAFGMSGEPTYFDGDGTLVSVGTHFNVRVETGGRVIYRNTEAVEGDALRPGDGEMIERARHITYEILGSTRGVAEVFFETIERVAFDLHVITFGFYVSGGRVHMRDDGFAARMTFAGGVITEAELYFAEFELTGEHINLLPGRQALAAAAGEFMLSYSPAGDERFVPARVRHDLGRGAVR